MSPHATVPAAVDDLKRQREYVDKMAGLNFEFGLTMAQAFVRGIRDLGYRSTGTATDELVDNSIQAGAETIDVVFGYAGRSRAKPTDLAVIDDGHGMEPDMARLSVVWGGTHREGDRTGFGRYGYGLPSASVSQGRAFSVYSKVKGGTWHRVGIDLDAIEAGQNMVDGKIVVAPAEPAELPKFVREAIAARHGDLEAGTVVHIERLDRLTWKRAATLRERLLEHFGVTYRNRVGAVADAIRIFVDGEPVTALDPLFLREDARLHDLAGVCSEAGEPKTIPVRDAESGEVRGEIVVRFAYMHPSFTKMPGGNERLRMMREHNGLIVLREGRQIDVITKNPWTSFLNNDRYWAVEVDFPATLDEEFSVTTSKQQVGLSEWVWQALTEAGVFRAITDMRRRYVSDNAAYKKAKEEGSGPRASEEAMNQGEKFKTQRPDADPDRDQAAEEAFEREVRTRAERDGREPDDVERDLVAETNANAYRVQEQDAAGAPFYRVRQVGGMKVLILNRAHRFYADVYAGPESTPRLRAAIEVLLFVLGDCEMDAGGDRRLFYETERSEWSRRLGVALDRLDGIDAVDDDAPVATEAEPVAAG